MQHLVLAHQCRVVEVKHGQDVARASWLLATTTHRKLLVLRKLRHPFPPLAPHGEVKDALGARQIRVTLAKHFISLYKSGDGCAAGRLVEGFVREGFHLHGRPSSYQLRNLSLAAVSVGQAVIQLSKRDCSGFIPSVAHEGTISDEWKACVLV